MPVTDYNNTSLTVSDMDRSIAWYRDNLGFEVLSDRIRDPEYCEALTGVDGAQIRMVHLDGSGGRIELMQYIKGAGGEIDKATNHVGAMQVGFMVDDAHKFYDELVAKGIRMRSKHLVEITEGPNKGGAIFFAEDPDGIVVKFLHLPAG
jgi:catechol 2,3-dioxygenase-like lactoylglutathione lyase family enzyme